MTTNPIHLVLQHVRRTALAEEGSGMTDGQLLECFVRHRETAALEALVQRHGAMVWGLCRRTLPNPHDAEDAFQATFLVLVRKAASIVPREMVGSWLYGVAHQTARKALATAAKRKTRERQVSDMPEPEAAELDHANELQTLLDRELARLPEKYRVPLLLCELEGKSRKEAARLLGWPEGTVAGRLARARALLAKQLARHGYTVTGATLAVVLSENATKASVPAALLTSTVQAISVFAAGEAVATGVISSKVAALTKGVLKAMLLTKLKIGVLLLGMGLGMAGLAYGALASRSATETSLERQPDPIRGERENGAAAPARNDVGEGGVRVAPENRERRAPKKAQENKPGIIDGIVQEIDDKHIRLTNGKEALLNDKTEYLRETGLDAAQITRKDVTPGKHVYISVKGTDDKPVALLVVLHLLQPPVKDEKRKGDAPAARPGLRSTLPGHLGSVASVAFSRDGRTLAAGSGAGNDYSLKRVGEGEVKFWDLTTRSAVSLHDRGVAFTVFALSPDGKRVATARTDGTVTLWERDGLRFLATLGTPSRHPSLAVAFSPDGKTLASGGDKILHLWDVRTKKLLRSLPTGAHSRALAFSPTGKMLAVEGTGPSPSVPFPVAGIQLWDLETNKKTAFLSITNPVLSVAFSPDGKRLATGDALAYVLLWDVATGKEVFPRIMERKKGVWEIRGHRQAVNAVTFSPDGKLLASASDDKTIKLWQVATGAELTTLTGHTSYVQSLSFNPKGDLLASGGADRTVRLWDIPRAWREGLKPRP